MKALHVPAPAVLLLLSTIACFAANAENGHRIAQRWCAACHLISPNQRKGTTDAPPFSAVARKPGFSAGRVALFLLAPHPKMPDMNLSRAEAADLAAYIATQR